MTQLLQDLLNFFSSLGSYFGSFFANSGMYLVGIIIIYIIMIIILVIWLHYSRKTFNSIDTLFKVNMDNLYYQISLILYNNKNNIYDFAENIPLLLQYKTQEISKRADANYYENYTKLIEEIEYVSRLTDSPLQYDRQKLDHQSIMVDTLATTLSRIKSSLSIITLGIARLFIH